MSSGSCRDVSCFAVLNKLGEGTYGTVFRARDRQTGEVVALKEVRIHSAREGFPRTALREIRMLLNASHPNVVKLQEVVVGTLPKLNEPAPNVPSDGGAKQTTTTAAATSPYAGYTGTNTVYLVFEYCEHDLAFMVDNAGCRFRQSEVKCIVLSLLRALHHLHMYKWIIHRDVKLSNLLLTNKGELKLADFGLAREYRSPSGHLTDNVATLWYRAPELLFGATCYSTAIDCWAAGCVLGELLAHKPMFPGQAEQQQISLICNLLGEPTWKIWPGIEKLPRYLDFSFPTNQYNNLRQSFPSASDNCLDLLNKLLTFDPSKRIAAREAIKHPYFLESPAPTPPAWMPTWREHRNVREYKKRKLFSDTTRPQYDTEGHAVARKKLLEAAERMKKKSIFG
eukprot:GHVS01055102.1.p1 GENE.GHVS01055102.1~~GHVS01055102.1.p1  ORF type:complete len:396 (+),score=37.69 GHVS01055102.1:90-1277(+)